MLIKQRVFGKRYRGGALVMVLALGGITGGRMPRAEDAREEAYRQAQARFEQLQTQTQTQTTLAEYRRVLELAGPAAQQQPPTETTLQAQELIVTCYDLLGEIPQRTQAALTWGEMLAVVRGSGAAAEQLLNLAKDWIASDDVETRQEPGKPRIQVYRPANAWVQGDLQKLEECQEAKRLFREIVEQYPAAEVLPEALVNAGRCDYQCGLDPRSVEREAFEQAPEDFLLDYHRLLEGYLDRQPRPEIALESLGKALELQLQEVRQPPGVVGVLHRVIADYFPGTPRHEAAEYACIWEAPLLVFPRARAFLQHWPESGQAEMVRFRLAMHLVFNPAGRSPVSPAEVEGSLTDLMVHHPQSPHVPWALFQLGRLAGERGEREEAAHRFREILDRYPHSEAVGIAQEYLQRIMLEPRKEPQQP